MNIVGRNWLHLLWTVPVAIIVSVPLWFWAGLSWCGISGCSGAGFGISRESQSTAWIALAISGVVMALAIGLVPWLRPLFARIGIAIVAGGLFVLLGVILTGGPTPPETAASLGASSSAMASLVK